MSTPDLSITISVANNGQNLAGKVPVNVNASSTQPPIRVEFYLDGKKRYTDNFALWQWMWDTTKVQDGTHIIRAEAIYPKRRSIAQIAVTVKNTGVVPPEDPDDPPPPPPPTNIHEIPTSIRSDGGANVATEIQTWINSLPNGVTMRLKSGGIYRVDQTIVLNERTNITFDGNGAEMRTPGTGDGHLSVLRVVGGSDILIKNLKCEGNYGNPGVHDTGVQWCHGIEALGTLRLTIDDCIGHNLGGDGIYLGLGALRCRQTRINRYAVDGTGRNGISFVAADDTIVIGGSCDNIGYIGLDVEPNSGTGFGVDGVLCDGVRVGDYFMSAATCVGDADIRNVTFKNILISAAKGCRMQVGTPAGRRRTNITFDHCTALFTSTTGSTYCIVASDVDGLTVTNNVLPISPDGSTVLLSASGCTGITFSGNVPNRKSGF